MNIRYLLLVTAAGLFSSTVTAITYDTNGGSSRGGGYSGYITNQYIESSDGPLPNLPSGGDYSAVQNQMNQSRAARNGQPFYHDGSYRDLGEPPCHRVRVRSAPRPCTPGNGCNSIKYPW